MGWFDEQIRQRKQKDEEMLQDAFAELGRVLGDSKAFLALESDAKRTDNAIKEILRLYKAKIIEAPASLKSASDRLEYVTRPNGIMRRTVKLEPGWYKNAAGAMLAVRKADGRPCALIPSRLFGYTYFDEEKGKRVRINKKNQGAFESDAITFYAPLPLKEIGKKELLQYIWRNVSASDRILATAAALAVALIGLFSPALTRILLSSVIESGNASAFLGITVFMACVSISGIMIKSVKTALVERIDAKTGLSLKAAIMMRILSLPAGFFKGHSSGELASRMQNAAALCTSLISLIFSCGLTALVSLVYLVQIFAFAPSLAATAAIVVIAEAAAIAIASLIQSNVKKELFELSAKENGLSYSLITGVQKIKLAGAETRAFAKWSGACAKVLEINTPTVVRANSAITLAISLAGTMAMYYFALRAQLPVADYYAFNTALGMLLGGFIALPNIVETASSIKPIIELLRPILEACPEISERKLVVERLSGGIELSHVSFRYSENMPLVLDNITQKKVSQSLDSLKCTRVAIARRLSTIRQCDRIVYLEGGRIVKDGTYDGLVAKNGKFAELVARQQVE